MPAGPVLQPRPRPFEKRAEPQHIRTCAHRRRSSTLSAACATQRLDVLPAQTRNPDPTELGWKETVKMHPGEVTTVIMKFDLPSVPFEVPGRPNTGGNDYVWHCHILEHEEHDMMRPLVVI